MKVELEKALEMEEYLLDTLKYRIGEHDEDEYAYFGRDYLKDFDWGWETGFKEMLRNLVYLVKTTGEIPDDGYKYIEESFRKPEEDAFGEGLYDGWDAGFTVFFDKIAKNQRIEAKTKIIEEGVDFSDVEESLKARLDNVFEETSELNEKWFERKQTIEMLEKLSSDNDIWESMTEEQKKEHRQKEDIARKERNYFLREIEEYGKITESLHSQLREEWFKKKEEENNDKIL